MQKHQHEYPIIQVQARRDKEQSEKNAKDPVSKGPQKTGRTDIDEEDTQESYFKLDIFFHSFCGFLNASFPQARVGRRSCTCSSFLSFSSLFAKKLRYFGRVQMGRRTRAEGAGTR